MNLNNEYLTHFGVYGVIIKNKKLFCVLKKSGPYKNRYDLPGGSQQINESLTETLCREISEETGYTIKSYSNSRAYDSFVKEKDKEVVVHHVFVLYDVILFDKYTNIKKYVKDGENDSEGTEWVALDALNIKNSSPVILKLLDEINKLPEILEKTVYEKWLVKEDKYV